MEYKLHNQNNREMAEILSWNGQIQSSSDILDLMTNVPARIIILRKEILHESFFDLRTGLAGEILQKFSNYDMKCAIVGDFTRYTSKSFRDFIHECNKTNRVLFLDSIESAIEKFSSL